jgi:hypothetical protein
MRVRLTNVRFVESGFEADVDLASGPLPGTPPPPMTTPVDPIVQPPPPILPAPFPELPPGYTTDPGVAFEMFTTAMARHGLTPTGVQGHGAWIVAAMNETWPGWNVYLSPSDAPVVPGPDFGSIDVTIDSGKGGWSFRPDGKTPYEPDPSKR